MVTVRVLAQVIGCWKLAVIVSDQLSPAWVAPAGRSPVWLVVSPFTRHVYASEPLAVTSVASRSAMFGAIAAPRAGSAGRVKAAIAMQVASIAASSAAL